MIKTNDLEISFSGQKIFSDVNIIINKKEKVGFIGRNGSGKSTFLKIIIGKLEQDSGEVMMPKGYKIGHLDQHIKFTQETVVDEVCSVLSGDREYETWKGESILTGLGFSYDDMEKKPEAFSGGNQVKINLAKLLLDEPDMLLLDEPTEGVQSDNIELMAQIIREEKLKGRGFLIVDQNLTFLEAFNDIMHLIDHGEQIFKIEGVDFRDEIEARVVI